jgi:4-amino-4-deoxy-L-arabinose transferase-like glycosyltransferase
MPSARRIRIVLFALVWFSCAWFGSWELNANTATRLFAAISLVEDGDATIDEFAPLTIDKATFDGHVYLDKAPGMTLMALPAVWIADRATGARAAAFGPAPAGPAFERYLRLRLRVAVAIGPAVLAAIAAVLLFDMAAGITGSAAAGLFAALGYALGTPVWGWSTTLLGHAVVADCYAIALWAIWRGTRPTEDGGDGGGGPYAALAGASLGWAVVVEHQAVLAGAVVAIWAIRRAWPRPDRWHLIGIAAAAGLLLLLPLAAYNLVAFGTPFRVGYSGVVGWEGMHQGLFGLGLPRLRALQAILFSFRLGLVWVAPVLVLAPLGLAFWIRDRRTRDVALVAAASATVVLLVNAAYVYWDGGNTTGPRFAIPAVAPLALGLAAEWMRSPGRGERLGMMLVLALSIAINAAIAAAEIFAPPLTAFPVWQWVIAGNFAHGFLRTVPGDWFGWSAWAGFACWAAPALAALAWLARAARRA